MSSIRPLVTITILVVVGAFLYVKINEGPVAPTVPVADQSAQIQNQSLEDVPPLSATAAAPSTLDASTAPLWPNTAAAAPPASSTIPSAATIPPSDALAPPLANVTTSVGEVAPAAPPAVPGIPEMPAIPVNADATTSTAANSLPTAHSLPSDIPVAQYPAQTPANSAALNADVGVTPPITSAIPGVTVPAANESNVVDVMAPQAVLQPGAPTSVPLAEAVGAQSAVAGAPADDSLAQNPLRQAAVEPNPAAQYPTSDTPVADVAAAPAEASFSASWPAIQSALERGDLAQAHQLLSPWHDEPSLSPGDAANIDRLLSQLAGTVIYSTEHRLQPARVVKPGESLETIAKECNVPWQLLAKINGIAAADQVRPGQELKVVPGPFSAVVDLGRSQLTLSVDGRYAGKFPVIVPIGMTLSEGDWRVEHKLVAPSSAVTQSAYTTQPAKVDHAIVLRSTSEAAPTAGGPTLAIASSSSPTSRGASGPAIQVSASDAEELSDILSIGSRVVIRR